MSDTVKILVIEDDLPSLANIQLLLKLEGFQVVCARDGISGLEAIRLHRPAIVLCDIMMPGMDGLTLLVRVRQDDALATTPFIFLTALSGYDNIRQGMNGGADDYLIKPFSPQELFHAIETRLRRFKYQQSNADALQALTRRRQGVMQALSDREMEVFDLIGRGATSRKIAEQLGISVRTVDTHRANIIAKLKLDSAASLVRMATAVSLVDVAP
jgi:FixJ family two-component response regulator